MSRRTGRWMVPAVLVAGAIVLAGCGGSSSRSSAYHGNSGNTGGSTQSTSTSSGGGAGAASLSAAGAAVKQAGANVKANPNDPNAWNQLASTSKDAADKIGAASLPASVQAAQQKYAAAVRTLSDDAAKVASALQKNDQSAAQADKIQYFKDALAYAGAAVNFVQAARAAGLS